MKARGRAFRRQLGLPCLCLNSKPNVDCDVHFCDIDDDSDWDSDEDPIVNQVRKNIFDNYWRDRLMCPEVISDSE
ncbi:small T antigen [Rhynchobatus djiddensis polyomavirus 1]|uniref:Small T antigen n=1 Tax=Rhynchobatus djiddensis polyomavirus 1 TaxID=2170102 RepID=A0A0B5CUK9_9POLY|nr:small T antigen [Rhynchobatus djiddensis polyomavirus 1]AJE25842.1 small T antigen [Rhynchobatus djiddensis polyomavirus 1]